MKRFPILVLLTLVFFVDHAPAWSQRVWPKRTPMSWNQARTQLVDQGLSDNAADVLTAQWALETQSGRKMWRYNFAGIKGVSPRGFYCMLSTSEFKKGKKIRIRAAFRAYMSPEAGAEDFVNIMNDRFPCAIPAAEKRDLKGFSQCLRSRKYYTSSARLYEKGLRRLLEKNCENCE